MTLDPVGSVVPADDAFRIGRVVALGVHVLGRAFLPICAIALLVAASQFVPALVQDAVGRAWISSAEWSWALRFAVDVVADSLGLGTIAYGAARVVRGGQMFFRTSVTRGFVVAAPVVVIELLVSSPDVLAFFVHHAAVSYLLATMASISIGSMMAVKALAGLFDLVELIAWSFLWVAIPVIVFERYTVTGAIRRSFELTRGCRFRIFALLVAVSVGHGVLSGVSILPMYWDHTRDVAPDLLRWAGYGLDAALVAVWSVTCGVSYVLLRTAKEGWSPDEVVRVFD